MNNNFDEEIRSVKQRFGIIGHSPLLNRAIQVAIQVAPTDMTVLITGESGTGKESFSKIIHQLSPRKHGKFIAINCGAIPEGTIDSELFGHEKGAFTGASDSRKGYFEVTDGGTIFLDEIGEMPLGTQTRLLRVLEYGEYIRVGSSKINKTNVRVVAATNVDLYKAVEKGKFREDLYYRLNNVTIYVPPLRDRGEDVLLLFRKFAADTSERYRRDPVKLDEEAKKVLLEFPFPGNIRQLKSIVEQISVLEIDRIITAPTLKKYLPSTPSMMPALFDNPDDSGGLNERELLYKILFDMKKDVNELRKLMHDVLNEEKHSSEILEENRELFHDLGNLLPSTTLVKEEHEKPVVIEPAIQVSVDDYENDGVEDISHETEDESLSLEKKEKELIIKALKKNNNKRKYAAQDLGISERTLYRKIKQYEIDD